MKKSQNKKIDDYEDDGHTIYNMDVDGLPPRRTSKTPTLYLTKKEKKAVIKGAYQVALPMILIIIFAFFLVMIGIYFWLR